MVSESQISQALLSADNLSMPECQIARTGHTRESGGVLYQTIRVRNHGLGPANTFTVGRYDEALNTLDQHAIHDVPFKFLGADKEDTFEVPISLLRKQGYVVRYESLHHTVIEHLIRMIDQNFDEKKIAERRPYIESAKSS